MMIKTIKITFNTLHSSDKSHPYLYSSFLQKLDVCDVAVNEPVTSTKPKTLVTPILQNKSSTVYHTILNVIEMNLIWIFYTQTIITQKYSRYTVYISLSIRVTWNSLKNIWWNIHIFDESYTSFNDLCITCTCSSS